MGGADPLVVQVERRLEGFPGRGAFGGCEEVEHLVHEGDLHREEAVLLVLQEGCAYRIEPRRRSHRTGDSAAFAEQPLHGRTVLGKTPKDQAPHREHVFYGGTLSQELGRHHQPQAWVLCDGARDGVGRDGGTDTQDGAGSPGSARLDEGMDDLLVRRQVCLPLRSHRGRNAEKDDLALLDEQIHRH